MSLSIKGLLVTIFIYSSSFYSQTNYPVLNYNLNTGYKPNAKNEFIQYLTAKDATVTEKIFNIYKTKNMFNIENTDNEHSFFNVTGQLVIGSVLSVGFSIIPLSVAIGDAWSGNRTLHGTLAGILVIPSYLFGAAVGAHWIASYENPDVSVWETLKYSFLGGCFSAVLLLYLANSYTTIPEAGGAVAFFSPVIASVIYTTQIAEWKSSDDIISKKYYYHKDFLEQDKIFEIMLLKVAL